MLTPKHIDDICEEVGRVADALWTIVFLLAMVTVLVGYTIFWR